MGVLLSGGGRTLQNFLDKIASGELSAEVKVVVSSREDAYGLVRAEKAGIDRFIVPSKKYKGDPDSLSRAIWDLLKPYELDLVTMAGFMVYCIIPPEYEGKVMNIHPALIPSFCGKGWYGERVHRAVLEYGVKITGCTVHFADNRYDHGPVIIQRTVPVLDDDTPDTLAARVFREECIAYPEAINLSAQGRLRIVGRRVLKLPAAGE